MCNCTRRQAHQALDGIGLGQHLPAGPPRRISPATFDERRAGSADPNGRRVLTSWRPARSASTTTVSQVGAARSRRSCAGRRRAGKGSCQGAQDGGPRLQFVVHHQRKGARGLAHALDLLSPFLAVDVADRQCSRDERGHQDRQHQDQKTVRIRITTRQADLINLTIIQEATIFPGKAF